MTPDEVAELFTRESGAYVFAHWGRLIVLVVFGNEDATLSVLKGAFEAVMVLVGHQMADTDPELGVDCMVFFFRDWSELIEVPDLDRLLPGLAELVERLETADANQYRVFRFNPDGGIRVAFVFLRMMRN